MKKKFLIVMLVLIVAIVSAFALTACGETETPDDGNGDNNNSTVVTPGGDTDNNGDTSENEKPGSKGLKYQLIDGGYEVSGYNGTDTVVIIPSTCNGYKVVSIATNAFLLNTSITSVTIPASITNIDDDAFVGCYRLVEVYNFSPLNIMKGAVDNGGIAFYALDVYTDATAPSKLTRDGGFVVHTAIDGVKTIVKYSGETPAVVIPQNVKKINAYAFVDSNVTEITVPESVTEIADGAFAECTIQKATVPAWACKAVSNGSLKTLLITCGETIGDGVLSGSYALCDVTIPKSIKIIAPNTFSCCSLTNIRISDLGGWLDVGGFYHNSAYNLYLDGELVTDLTIPDGVTSVNTVFANCSSITSVTIPGGVTEIADGAFADCQNLSEITLPDSLKTIGERAFSRTALTEITLPDSIIEVGKYAFEYVSTLERATLSSGLTEISDSLFSGCESLTSVTIHNGVTSIGSYAFSGTGLKGIAIPDTVTSIGDSVFGGDYYGAKRCPIETATIPAIACSSVKNNKLKTVVITSGESIEDNALSYCGSLTSVTVPNSVSSIGSRVFYNCGLTSITIPDSVTRIGSQAFEGCLIETATIPAIACSSVSNGKLKTVVITSGESIGSGAFLGCSSLTSVTIGNSVTSIESSAFYNCSSLTSVTIGNSVTSIGSSAFYNCSSLTGVAIPNSVTSIGSNAFYNCSSLTSVTIGNSVTSIGSSAFYNCSSLTGVAIPNSVTSIGSNAFYNCSSLTSVTIGNGVTSIGSSAFSGCNSLAGVYISSLDFWCSINFADFGSNPLYFAHNLYINGQHTVELKILGITSISNYAFSDCRSLTSITIGDNVTSIGKDAFLWCFRLAEVYNLSSLNITKGSNNNGYVGYYALDVYTDKDTPSKLTRKNDFVIHTDGSVKTLVGYVSDKTEITIPNSVTSIGNCAFSGCINLMSITLPNSVTSIGDCAFV